MKTLREKITFSLSAIAYILFHLGWSPDSGSIVTGTLAALLNTLPYEIGMAYIVVAFIRYISKGKWPPWDRIARIFFMIGIISGLFYNLYEMGAQEQKRQQVNPTSVSYFLQHNNRTTPLYWA